MSDVLFAVMWLIYSFWLGHEVGLRRERKQSESLTSLARCVIDQAKDIKQSRQFVGGGVTIQNKTFWSIGDVGKFAVTVEEQNS